MNSGNLLKKVIHSLLDNEVYAWLLVAALVLLPFADWVSASIIALITLRKSPYAGFKALVIGLAISLLVGGEWLYFILCYAAALVLRITANWNIAISSVLVVILAGVIGIQCLLPNYVMDQYHALIALLQTLDNQSPILGLLDSKFGNNQVQFANYLLGIKAFCIALSAISSLMLARSMQSRVFYPGGFKDELLNFRATKWAVLLLLCAIYGAYQSNDIAISCLPSLAIYVLAAGSSLLLYSLQGKKRSLFILLVFLPLIAAPYLTLPVYVLFGSLDSVFNFRLQLALKRKKIVNKG